MEENKIHQIGFSMAKGMQGDPAIEMLRRIGSPHNYFHFTRGQLSAMAGVDSKIFDDAYRQALLERARQEAQFIEGNRIESCFYGEDDYPHRLQECPDAPSMLYKLGRCPLNGRHVVGVVGTRHATGYGVEFTQRFVADLAKMLPDVVIVSGLAYGIDIAAHKAAMDAGVGTVAVLAHGLDIIYPAMHRDEAARIIERGGALITEYPAGTRKHPQLFLARNRIVAGISDCLVVVESDFKGGSMSTARIAAQYNRDVFAVPGRVNDTYSRGVNRLIAKNVASLLMSAQDLMDFMNWEPQQRDDAPEAPRLFKPLTLDQQQLLDFIKDNPQATVNDMCVKLGMAYSTLSTRLFELEDADLIRLIPGGRYALTL